MVYHIEIFKQRRSDRTDRNEEYRIGKRSLCHETFKFSD